ncbi:MAG: hypothetical protein QOE33_3274 [Acidobacteriota bacterium]|nr:hypothetical protein [Acidobacteriota bacterium]
MRKALTSLCLTSLLILAAAPDVRPYTQQFTASSVPVHWATNTITVYLASSVNAPPANIKAGSDVEGAVRRALHRWSNAANINFDIRTGGPDAVGASNDGFSVISVSSANASFVPAATPGRTRISFDPNTGAIAEADVAINPNLLFSTDGTHATYDLESTLAHEIGHFLGLDHSALVGATMQPHQVQNFTSGGFNLTQITARTLSDDDLAGIRALYGQRTPRAVGSVQGALNYAFAGAHVWVEDATSGRVVASAITKADGSYRIDQIPPGNYRVRAEHLDEPVRASEITSPTGPYSNINAGHAFQAAATAVTVTAGGVTTVALVVNVAPTTLNARVQGLNGIVHAGAMPVAAGTTYRYYVGGDGVDQVLANGFFIDSPYFQIDAASYATEPFLTAQLGYPVVSFTLRVLDHAKPGDYTLRMRRADTGETAYLAAGLVVGPDSDESSPVDTTNSVAGQH